MRTPSVFISKTSNVILITESTSAAVTGFDLTGQHTIGIDVFTRDYLPSCYPVAKMVLKLINNKFNPPSEGEFKTLKGIIMSESRIIAVNAETMQVIGRFADTTTASVVVPDDAVIITEIDDITANFTKSQMCLALGCTVSKQEVAQDLAEKLWTLWMAADIQIAEPVRTVKPGGRGRGRTPRTPKMAKTPRGPNMEALVRDILATGEVLTLAEIHARLNRPSVNDIALNSMIAHIKNPNYSDNPLNILSGKTAAGVRVYQAIAA